MSNGLWAGLATQATTATVVDDAVTAATTQTLAAATQLTGTYANITVCANTGDSVKLPPAPTAGQQIWVTNAADHAAWVYPGESGSQIDGGTAGAKVVVTNAKSALFTCLSTGQWQSIGSAARAA